VDAVLSTAKGFNNIFFALPKKLSFVGWPRKSVGVHSNLDLVVDYYKWSAERGDPDGANNFSFCLEHGRDIKHNIEAAAECYTICMWSWSSRRWFELSLLSSHSWALDHSRSLFSNRSLFTFRWSVVSFVHRLSRWFWHQRRTNDFYWTIEGHVAERSGIEWYQTIANNGIRH
jgi:hypothetical protein